MNRVQAAEPHGFRALLSDIQEAIKNKEKEYFLGSIVVTGPINQRFQVVDGQQRLATISLLISSIKDKFVEQKEIESATSLRTDYLVSMDPWIREVLMNPGARAQICSMTYPSRSI